MTDEIQTIEAVKRLIEDSVGKGRSQRIRITPYFDHANEPALSIAVSMKETKDIPSVEREIALTHQLKLALDAIGSPRFPYLYFDALDEPGGSVDDFELFDDALDHG